MSNFQVSVVLKNVHYNILSEKNVIICSILVRILMEKNYGENV